MAYLTFTANGEEFDRRELDGPVVVGRAPDCDISVPDIMLSRHHCRLEPTENERGWQVIDLHSKNGTHLRGKPVATYILHDGDELRIGRTLVTYRAAAFAKQKGPARQRAVIRPTDPSEALAGTITGMVLCEPGEVARDENMPFPQPRPSDPNAYARENLYGMINEIASSSWDSIMAQNSEPVRMQRAMPAAAATRAARGSVRPRPRVSFCLQAEHRESANVLAAAPAAGRPVRARRARRSWLWVTGGIVGTAIFITTWVTLILAASRPPDAGAMPPSTITPTQPAEQSLGEESAPPSVIGEPALWDAIAIAV